MGRVGKTDSGKLYHILNIMEGGNNFSLCGCYMPKDKLEDGLNVYELEKQNKMCEKCMYIACYKQDRD